MSSTRLTAGLVMVSLALAQPAFGDGQASHGGQYIDVEGHRGIEMVAGADALTFHLTDDHKPMDLKGAQFKVIVQSNAGTTTLPLVAEGSTLKAQLKAPIAPGAKIVLTGKDGRGHTLQGRFVQK